MARQQVRVLPATLRVLRTRLDGRNRSQVQLARDASRYAPVSPSLIHAIEAGDRQPGLASAMAIARALNVPVAAFAEVLIPIPELDAA